jgi:hypothetical protein
MTDVKTLWGHRDTQTAMPRQRWRLGEASTGQGMQRLPASVALRTQGNCTTLPGLHWANQAVWRGKAGSQIRITICKGFITYLVLFLNILITYMLLDFSRPSVRALHPRNCPLRLILYWFSSLSRFKSTTHHFNHYLFVSYAPLTSVPSSHLPVKILPWWVFIHIYTQYADRSGRKTTQGCCLLSFTKDTCVGQVQCALH